MGFRCVSWHSTSAPKDVKAVPRSYISNQPNQLEKPPRGRFPRHCCFHAGEPLSLSTDWLCDSHENLWIIDSAFGCCGSRAAPYDSIADRPSPAVMKKRDYNCPGSFLQSVTQHSHPQNSRCRMTWLGIKQLGLLDWQVAPTKLRIGSLSWVLWPRKLTVVTCLLSADKLLEG